MKVITAFLSVFLFVSCANGKERTYTGSTPASGIIRSFLGISPSDSVDFIRWKLTFNDLRYELHCQYGIGKPNTNGFINGGKKIDLSGGVYRDNNYYGLKNDDKILRFIELNEDLLHLLNWDNSLLAGNGGWSYTLNNISPSGTGKVSITTGQIVLKDSMVFEGRTPCKVPGVIPAGTECYKLKWHLVLYASKEKNEPAAYKVYGTAWRKENGMTGTWKSIRSENGSIIYQLNDNKGKGLLYLLNPGVHILLFTDAGGKLLVGNEDFSYTLNRL